MDNKRVGERVCVGGGGIWVIEILTFGELIDDAVGHDVEGQLGAVADALDDERDQVVERLDLAQDLVVHHQRVLVGQFRQQRADLLRVLLGQSLQLILGAVQDLRLRQHHFRMLESDRLFGYRVPAPRVVQLVPHVEGQLAHRGPELAREGRRAGTRR